MSHIATIGEVKRVGGWKGSPNSLAALRPGGIAFQPRCERCKGQPAIRGTTRCKFHTPGRRIASPAYGRAERRVLVRLERLGLLPLELLALPVWRNLAPLKTAQRAPMRLALVQAWDLQITESLRWAAVHRQARDLAIHGPQFPQHASKPWADYA
jgi:hypothetical protein